MFQQKLHKVTEVGIQSYYNTQLFFQKTKFQVEFINNQEIQYVKDGVILRKQNLIDGDFKLEIMKNLDQIRHLNWQGDYGENHKKIGKWNAVWNGQEIEESGGQYNIEGLKTGVWIELFENYWDKSKIIYKGEYINGLKNGQWNIVDVENEKIIGGGVYDEYGKKKGLWIDLHKNYWQLCQTIEVGQYQNDQKVGEWIIKFRRYLNDEFQQIAGGHYDQNGLKMGIWIELHDNFWNLCPIVQEGQYNLGIQRGQWNIIDVENKQIIGAGHYNEYGQKEGNWIELFDNYWRECRVLSIGSYMKGKKHGKWEYICQESNQILGGGIYNQHGLKNDEWIDLHENFWNGCQIKFVGNYKDGIKQGEWIYQYRYDQYCDFQNHQSGKYSDDGKKSGKWFVIHENFWNCGYIVYTGEYINGMKIGQWDILLKDTIIGGGLYDENEYKNGKWIDIPECFSIIFIQCNKVLIGEYINGSRQGILIDKKL